MLVDWLVDCDWSSLWSRDLSGCCGGCNARPGVSVRPCVAEEYPQRMCNVTRWYPGWWYGGRRRGPRRRHYSADDGEHDRRKRHIWFGL